MAGLPIPYSSSAPGRDRDGTRTQSGEEGIVGTYKLIGAMALAVIAGTPMVWYLWEVLNELLSGRVDGFHALVAVPVLFLFTALLVVLSRLVRRWDEAAP